jgi:hypothetical protein
MGSAVLAIASFGGLVVAGAHVERSALALAPVPCTGALARGRLLKSWAKPSSGRVLLLVLVRSRSFLPYSP